MRESRHGPNGKTKAKSRAWDALIPSLSDWILEATASMGFDRMTPVQASTIPLFSGNKDVVVEAVTGSGKTLAFLIPILEKLLRLDEPTPKHHVAAAIISPTRELASQIHAVLFNILSYHPSSAAQLQAQRECTEPAPTGLDPPRPQQRDTTKHVILPQLLVGGASSPQKDLSTFLKHSANVLIGTPGRLLDLLSSPHVHCPQSSFEVLVLDEADRLLDLGFKDDLGKILQRIPKQRRTGLFSASVSEAVDQLVRVGLRNPVRVNVKVMGGKGSNAADDPAAEGRLPASLKTTYLTLSPHHKLPALLRLLSQLPTVPHRTIVYLSTCASVDYFTHLLPALIPTFFSPPSPISKKLKICSLHGALTPKHRNENLETFSTTPSDQVALLLTTDLGARGLDIPLVDVTVQVDPPADPKTYIHRAGRAGRAGRKGLSILFLTPGREAEEYPSFLMVRGTPVSKFELAPNQDTDVSPEMLLSESEALDATRLLRRRVLTDRTHHDRAQRAFPGYVRSYAQHHAAKSIFRVEELDWQSLVRAWGLLRVPRMPELKKSGVTPKELLDAEDDVTGLDWDKYAYRDKGKEKKRLEESQNPPDEDGSRYNRAKSGSRPTERYARSKQNAADKMLQRKRKSLAREHKRKAKLSHEELEKEEEADRLIKRVRQEKGVTDAEDATVR